MLELCYVEADLAMYAQNNRIGSGCLNLVMRQTSPAVYAYRKTSVVDLSSIPVMLHVCC